MLDARGIRKRYGKKSVLHDVDIQLKPGKTLGLFGPNGSGKSTLIDILALAAEPDEGEVRIDGKDARARGDSLRARIGYVPQDIALFEELTVKENLICFSRLTGREAKDRAAEVSLKLSIEELFNKKITELSGGMKRRVNYAVALLGEADLFLLDEPFSGVDLENAARMLDVIRERKAGGATHIISEHSAHLVMPILDEAMVLLDGRVIFKGSPEELLRFSPIGEADDAVFRCVAEARK